jgi:hypothetical protein
MDFAGGNLSVDDPDASHAQAAESLEGALQALDVALSPAQSA